MHFLASLFRRGSALVGAWLLAGALLANPALADRAPTDASLSAAEPITVGEAFATAPLQTHIALFEDKTARREFDDVRAHASFEPAGERGTSFGFSHSAWWVRVDIRNERTHDVDVALRQDYPLIDYLDLWIESEEGGWRTVHTGDRMPFDSRPLAHRDFVFPVHVPRGATRTVYLRFASSGAVNIGLSLYANEALLESISLEQLAYGFYFGGFCVLFFYNLFIFVAVRDRAIFYYLFYAASYGLYFGVHDGLSFQFLWPDNPRWGNQALLVLLCLSLYSGMQFARHFLSTARHSPRLDRAARALLALDLLALAASFFLPYATLIQPVAYGTIVSVGVMMAMGGLGLARGYLPARIFVVAWGALLVGVLVYMAKTFGLLPHNAFTQNGFQAGALLEMVLLSLALAARLNDLQRQTLTDALTSLHNRRYFDAQLEQSFARARDGAIALLIIDIDHFKQINDSHGHARGDAVLIELGNLLRHSAPRGATVCRFGGEEFSIILPFGDEARAAQTAEDIRRAVEAQFKSGLGVTVSIGVASSASQSYGNESEFFHAADEALYRAKSMGRNRVELATADDAAPVARSGIDRRQPVPPNG